MNNESQKLGHHNCRLIEYYYEVLTIDVNTSGYYMFLSDSSLNTYGYFYEHQFDPYSSNDTSIDQRDNSCEDHNFTFTVYLQFNIRYFLVITTSFEDMNAEGSFAVIVKGPDTINMKQIGMYIFNRNVSKDRKERAHHVISKY